MIKKLKSVYEHILFRQFFKFCMVGALGATLTYLIFVFFYRFLHVYYIFSSALGFLIPTIVSFFLNKNFTFGVKGNHQLKTRILKYYSVSLFSTLISLLFLKFFVEILLINAYIADLFAIATSATSNFIGNKLFVFKDEQKNEENIRNNIKKNKFSCL